MKVCPTCKTEFTGGEVFCPVDGTRLLTPSVMTMRGPDATDPLLGTTLSGRYKLLRRIGEGGMGVVYEAEHTIIEKRVAVKVLRDDFSSRTEVVERFRQEAKSASRIGHEHIVDISDFGETPTGASYFVMEMLDGEDLADVLAREGTLAPARAVKIIVQCAKALGAAHNKGIVHRDMKPENIFLIERDGEGDFVKIVDFGIAKMSDIEMAGAPGRKLTKTGMIFGTPEYMSPEQAAGKPLDHRVDIYALGVILYELISGRVPFVGDTFMGVLTQHMFEVPPALRTVNAHVRVSPEVEAVIFRALAKNVDERYQTMDELARALARSMELPLFPQSEGTATGYGEPIAVRSLATRQVHAESAHVEGFPARRGRSRNRLLAGAVVFLLLCAGAVGYVALHLGSTVTASTRRANVSTPPPLEPHELLAIAPQHATDAGPATTAPPGTDDVGSAGGRVPAADMVTLTIPSRGVVTVDGAVVCGADQSPCQFRTPRGQAIRVEVRRGEEVGRRQISPTRDERIDILLRSPRRSRGGMGQSSPPGGGTGQEGELKIPDIFRHGGP